MTLPFFFAHFCFPWGVNWGVSKETLREWGRGEGGREVKEGENFWTPPTLSYRFIYVN